MDIKPAGMGMPLSAKPDAKAGLKEAAEGFEAIFLRQMLASARQTNFGSELFNSSSSDTFKQMRDDAFAEMASERGVLGLSDMIEAQVSRHMPQE